MLRPEQRRERNTVTKRQADGEFSGKPCGVFRGTNIQIKCTPLNDRYFLIGPNNTIDDHRFLITGKVFKTPP
jgi:hypothetical protein